MTWTLVALTFLPRRTHDDQATLHCNTSHNDMNSCCIDIPCTPNSRWSGHTSLQHITHFSRILRFTQTVIYLHNGFLSYAMFFIQVRSLDSYRTLIKKFTIITNVMLLEKETEVIYWVKPGCQTACKFRNRTSYSAVNKCRVLSTRVKPLNSQRRVSSGELFRG